MTPRIARATAVLLSSLLVVGGLLAVAGPAAAAGTLVVTSTADSDANHACTTASITVVASPTTLRNALCVANNLGGGQTVQVPDGSYTLTTGPLAVGTLPGSDITVQAAPGATPTVTGDGTDQVFTLDPGQLGGMAATIDGLTVTGGVDNVYGGGALIGGSASPGMQPDSLVVRNSTFSGNAANTVADPTNQAGGAIQFVGGSLTVTGSTFSQNSSGSSAGGAIAYQSVPGMASQALTVSGSTFSKNSTKTVGGVDNGGAAIWIADPAGGTPLGIDTSTFDQNGAVGSAGNTARGGAIWLESGALGVIGSTFTANTVSGGGTGAAAIDVAGGSLTAHFNRIAGNVGGAAVAVTGGATANATQNWWGCSGGPGASGCDNVSGLTASPYLKLTATASPTLILPPSTSSTVTAGLLTDSAGGAVDPASLDAFDGLPIVWSGAAPAGAGSSPSTSALALGVATTTYHSQGTTGQGSLTAKLDSGTAVAAVATAVAPLITSPATASAIVGTTGTVTVTTTGFPAPTLTISPAVLPTGLTFTDKGNGTATITGAPAAGTGGSYSFVITAQNVVSTTTQTLTLNVRQSPSFTSAGSAAFVAGSAGSFVVTASGRPTPTPISETGTLPAGVTFLDNGNGTATISGTPTAGTGGAYPLTLTADNAVGTAASQSFTLTVTEAPSFTGPTSVSGTIGVPFSETVTTGHAYPAVTTITIASGALPTGLTLADNGDGTATISGTPTGTGGDTDVALSASNGVSPDASQTVHFLINQAPAITLPAAAQTVNAGNTVSFTAGASGYPAPGVQWYVSTNGGSTYTAIPGATSATYSFTAAQSDNRRLYLAGFTNAAGFASTHAALSVGTAPTISSAAAARFAAGGGAQSFAVTTSGIPDAALSLSGTRPAWLSFTDNGDGTATLAGTPPVGSSGQYPFTIAATNGFSPAASQSFVLTVSAPPTFTSASAATLSAGAAGSFAVTTTAGFPAATTITETGSLPTGVTYTDNGDGSAMIAGTPRSGTGGVYTLTLTASNGVATNAVQTLRLTVVEAVAFTSPATLTVTRGVGVDFAVTTGAAYPAVSGIAVAGALPAGLTFTDNGDGTATIGGTTVAPVATTPLVLIASASGRPDVTQPFMLVVEDAQTVPLPLITPTASGPLAGVPGAVKPGDTLTLTAAGFAPDAPVSFGIYSAPTLLTVVNADATGTATATVTIPAGFTGAHSLVAAGIAPDGSVRYLRTDITLPSAPVTPGGTGGTASGGTGSGTAGTNGGELPDTGLDVSGLALLALLLLAAGAAVALRRRPRNG
ncbi:beta strand repeat-containing protein [Leifsonia poae]|uniref:beta strand repeat-containing protein n=1 Tax=Leifsonia poae TaxID=110933 RepID=UPI001CBC4C20|nr:putative Ig domain-containing protein [Leifsonia poae]